MPKNSPFRGGARTGGAAVRRAGGTDALRLIQALSTEMNVNALVELTGGTQANICATSRPPRRTSCPAEKIFAGLLRDCRSVDLPLCESCGSIEKQLARQTGAFSANGR
jgi:hypothetical protein